MLTNLTKASVHKVLLLCTVPLFRALSKQYYSSFRLGTGLRLMNKNVYMCSNVNESMKKVRHCDGCGALLQSKDRKKYGYIDAKLLQQTLETDRSNLQNTYNQKVQNKDTKTLEFLRQIQQQLNIPIFNNQTQSLDNMNDLQVLVKLQQKMEEYESQNQLSKRTPKHRSNILCYRCWCLKNYNRLPEEYDYNEGFITEKAEVVMRKIFNKHRGNPHVEYFYVLDVLDLLGSLQEWLLGKLLVESVPFSIVINKIDIVNGKYLNQTNIHTVVRQKVNKIIKDLDYDARQINYFFVSAKSRDGMNKLQKHMKNNSNDIQLIGYPNTGKTTLLNILTRMPMPSTTSKIPGTTTRVTEHRYHHAKSRRIFDMPGLYNQHLLYNLIDKPSLKALLTWHKKVAPGLLTHQAFIYGGRIECPGTRIVIFGLGGACSSDNTWFISNYREFWKGLPSPSELKMKRYEHQLTFINGKTEDLEIGGYGFIGFRLCQPSIKKMTKKVVFYLPEGIYFNFRKSILSDDEKVFHNKSGLTKRFMLERLHPPVVKSSK